jgi:hypothetical protein
MQRSRMYARRPVGWKPLQVAGWEGGCAGGAGKGCDTRVSLRIQFRCKPGKAGTLGTHFLLLCSQQCNLPTNMAAE